MANLYFNDLEVTADRRVLEEVLAYVDAEKLWAAKPELEPHDITDMGDRLLYAFDSKIGVCDHIEKIAAQFPNAHFVLTFRNVNESVYGFAEYSHGVEVHGKVVDDCGGL